MNVFRALFAKFKDTILFRRVLPFTPVEPGVITTSGDGPTTFSPMPEAMKVIDLGDPQPFTCAPTSTSCVNNFSPETQTTVSTAGYPADFPFADPDPRSPAERQRHLEKLARTAEKRNRIKKIAKASKKRNRR